MRVTFCFSGWVSGADVHTVEDAETGETVNIDGMDPKEVQKKLSEGTYLLCLGDHLYTGRKNEIEIFDFEVTK